MAQLGLFGQGAYILSRARGVNCLPEQVLPQSGADGALATALSLFDPNAHVVGMEEPGYATAIEVFQRMGFSLVPLPVTRGPEAYLAALEKHKPKVVFCTPSHQFPTGTLMPLGMRTRVLRWAQANNAYLIEDDSCNEYRYEAAPIPSLQSLDAFHRVVYLCNVSKVLSPAMRIAYLVLPPKLLSRHLRLYGHAHPPTPYLEQEALARFIEQGHWDAHVRRMSIEMRRRHDALLQSLERHLGDSVQVEGRDAGMHFYLTVDNGMTQEELMRSALREGAAAYGTKRMWFSRRAPESHLMLGFSAIEPNIIDDGVRALARAWFGSPSP